MRQLTYNNIKSNMTAALMKRNNHISTEKEVK